MSDRVIAILAVLVLILLLVAAAIWAPGNENDQGTVRLPTVSV